MLATAAHAAPITLEQVDSGAVIQTTVVKDIVTNPSLEDSLFRQGG